MSKTKRKRTLWAAYAGSAYGSEITLHATKRDALEVVVAGLGIYDPGENHETTADSPDERAPEEIPLADLDDDELTDRIDQYCATRADDWHVSEVEIP